MPRTVPYDAFADIYDVWTGTEPVCQRNLPFYTDEYVRTAGTVVELGVGTGRIAIEAAKRGKRMIGVDSSSEMLKRCRQRADAAGVADMVTLIQADFRDFALPGPAELIAIPFHSIGFLLTSAEKLAALRNIYHQLAPGGRLVFDHCVCNPQAAARYAQVSLLKEHIDAESGRDVLIWAIVRFDESALQFRIVTWTDELDQRGVLLERKYRRLHLSLIDPPHARDLVEQAGFTVEALFGDFDRRPFDVASTEQIWVVRRPA